MSLESVLLKWLINIIVWLWTILRIFLSIQIYSNACNSIVSFDTRNGSSLYDVVLVQSIYHTFYCLTFKVLNLHKKFTSMHLIYFSRQNECGTKSFYRTKKKENRSTSKSSVWIAAVASMPIIICTIFCLYVEESKGEWNWSIRDIRNMYAIAWEWELDFGNTAGEHFVSAV